jgi:hypothetical protein
MRKPIAGLRIFYLNMTLLTIPILNLTLIHKMFLFIVIYYWLFSID